MAKAILLCGKICCGKTTYAQKLIHEQPAVLLSVDEIMLALLDPQLGDQHEIYSERTQQYLFQKALEITGCGMNVVLDWGFWQRSRRQEARSFFAQHGIVCEFHYLCISDGLWHERLDKRNRAVLKGETAAYLVDDGLAAKFESLFEAPSREEMDVWLEDVQLTAFRIRADRAGSE